MKHLAGGIQWTVFLIASSIAAPIAIAHVFGMDPVATSLFMQRTIFVLGIACLIQAFCGHRMPINEGPAGLWWGIYVVYAGMVGIFYSTAADALQALQSGMLYSGILFIILAATGVITKMKALFTPAITFTYLLLLILQLSGTFITGMIGVENAGDYLDPAVLGGSLLVLLVTFAAMANKRPSVSKYAVLISIGLGWGIFLLLGKTPAVAKVSDQFIQLPKMFVYGPPVWDSGVLVTAVFITFLLVANMLASIRVMEHLLEHSFQITPPDRLRQGAFASGVNHLIAGLFSAIGSVPISGSAGFVGTTRMPSIKPFMIGSTFLVLITLFPSVMAVFAALPAPVAYAVTFAIFTKMVSMAFNELDADPEKERARQAVAFGLMVGVGTMFVPAESLSQLPAIVASTLSNGLITGTILAILIEQFMIYRSRKRASN
ncbi:MULTISPECIES: purine/pyrimidine permease [unclassified Sporosarcina]|uniref:purine/pyrimidine permease n=1 Tax=unclassified Sporosarcina TaxID=2647733 RepID=UPI0020410E04|nr:MULTISPECIES: purine/pyrimidine permease [unclassified Sporosarcina]GKV64971.1 purine permease [Sporosarcina sp. NCCP-2331]GLB56606.1 purine permease [Sporosarcina sp. NCCP-2378]